MMFTVIFVALAGFVNRSFHESVLQSQDETAFQVAEAGLNYARWRLAHDPDNFAPETKTVSDQLAGELGTYSVTFVQLAPGSTVVAITSEGSTIGQPLRSITLKASYGRPSLARYASIINSDVRYGSTIHGPAHANGGIRMDGYSDSTVSSAKATYACQTASGCQAPYQTKPGVWGTGQKQELWQFPVTPVDFNALTLDLLSIKQQAQASNTYYGPSNKYGYRIVFNSNNTYTIVKVKNKGQPVQSYMSGTGYETSSYDVGQTQTVETKTVPHEGVIFVEDHLWVSGDIRDRVTVAAGVFPDQTTTNADVIINGNISYGGVRDGSRAFAAIAQRHIRLPWSGVPDTLTLDGAYVAQKGSFHRRYYNQNDPVAGAHALKTRIIRNGMVASNQTPVTAWLGGGNQVTSGFRQGESNYDANLLYGPPPFFPTSGQYEFIAWEQQ